MYEPGELISVIYPCMGLKCQNGTPRQMILPGIKEPDLYNLDPGELGIVIGSSFYKEYGWVAEVMFGDVILSDVPADKLASATSI
jgi:hypothetical protein